MPALDVEAPGVSAVASFTALLVGLLDDAAVAKQTSAVEPALNKSDFDNLSHRVSSSLSPSSDSRAEDDSIPNDQARAQRYAVIETSARDLFSDLLATTSIDSPDFVKMWNLLDILSILSDDSQCDPALLFWLVEELLDSQTIAGCRKIFDFLESRREQITAKFFKQKQLTILRTCNELLRRLSRAEDTAFCGRVFIFLFQSFPLGDRSSVNLRGEYHIENVTNFETEAHSDSQMDIDGRLDESKEPKSPSGSGRRTTAYSKNGGKPLEPEALYPLFWSLQDSFSHPMKLFDSARFSSFKENLGATMKAFQAISSDQGSRIAKSTEESKQTLKRKRDDEEDGDLSNAFNPKYLTSKDLFQLEISDLSFRRHVLVQALIIMDFLLSLSAQAKEKLATAKATNKSVMYTDQILAEDDAKWTNDMKTMIAEYLKRQGTDGPYFYRMVETVLARDKNWVRWKIESCPFIQLRPVTAELFVEARDTAQRTATNKRLRPVSIGAVSLDFLRDQHEETAMEQLRSEDRFRLPELDGFRQKIADDDFEIGMPTNNETKAAAIAGKASKSWRALRIASRSKLAAFDKIDDAKKVDVVFEDLVEADDDEEDADPTASEESMPENRDLIIISGPPSVGKTALIESLMAEHKGVFAQVVRHTTREALDGEVNGKAYHFVKPLEFNQLRDGDRLIEYGTRDGTDYGTSSKAVDDIMENGKVPIVELDMEAAQFAKDMDAAARFVFVKPPSNESMADRLRQSGKDAGAAESILQSLQADMDDSKLGGLFDTTIANEQIDEAAKTLGDYIFGKGATTGPLPNGKGDTDMADAPTGDEKGDAAADADADGA